jgi:hypothetical protein
LKEVDCRLKACDQTRAWKNWATTITGRPRGLCEAATLLTHLDTGIWANEMVRLRFGHLKQKNISFEVCGKGAAGPEASGPLWQADPSTTLELPIAAL